MTTMVCFHSAGADYCIPVQATRAVRLASDMIPLPAPGPDIAGIIAGDPPLTVISPLGTGGAQVLVLEAGQKTFGLLVDAVTGLQRISASQISAPPDGQHRRLVSGTITSGGHVILMTDPNELAGQL